MNARRHSRRHARSDSLRPPRRGGRGARALDLTSRAGDPVARAAASVHPAPGVGVSSLRDGGARRLGRAAAGACDDELRAGGAVVHRGHAGAAARRRAHARRSCSSSSAPTRLQKLPRGSAIRDVLDLAHFVVVSRPGYHDRRRCARASAGTGRAYASGRRAGADRPLAALIFLLHGGRRPTSRRRPSASGCARGESIAGLVPPLVEAHILKHRLYARPADHLHGEI